MGFTNGRIRRKWVVVAAAVFVLFATLGASCNPPTITVSYSKTPARGTTTVTVTVTGATVTQTTVRVDNAAANPVATSSSSSFQFDLDTTTLIDGAHKLLVTSQTSTRHDLRRLLVQGRQLADGAPARVPAIDRVQRAHATGRGALRVRRACLRRREGRPDQGVREPLRDDADRLRRPLRTKVYSAYDHGLLGMALDPQFPTKPYVYVLYTLDAPIGGTPPVWNDNCPTPPGADIDGCVVSGRLSRLQAAGNVMTGTEKVLINDWCQQFSSHSIGSHLFGADGALYASGGDGAAFIDDRLRPERESEEPVRRSAGSRRRHADATDRRGRRAALAGPRSLPAIRSRSTARSSASIPRPAPAQPDNPNAGKRRPERAADRRVRIAQPVPHHDAARHQRRCGSATSAGTTWEEIDRSPNPKAAPMELRLAVLRRKRAATGLRRR